MKKLLFIASALVLMLCGCSPKLANNIAADTIPEVHPDYAVVYFYRTGNYVQTPYNVYLGDDVVYRSKNNTKAAVRVDKPGTYEIWGKTESRESLTLEIEMGKEYYVKTFVHFGVALWRPSIELRSKEEGLADWNSIK